MSIRPEAQTPFDRSEWVDLARERLRWGVNSRRTKNCGHNFCDLTQPRCCSCIDTRPIRARYYKYVDGRGMVLEGKRWSNYCPGCQIRFGEPEESEPDAMQEVRRDSSFAEVRCGHCERTGHYVWECPRNNLADADLSDSDNTTITTTPPSLAISSVSSAASFHQQNLIPPRPGQYRPEQYRPPAEPVFGTRQGVNVNQTPHENSHGFYFGGRGPHPAASQRTPAASTLTPPTPSPPSLSPPRPVPRLTTHEQRRARIQANYERTFGSLRDIANDPEYVSPLSFMHGDGYSRFQEREAGRRPRQQAESIETDSTQTRPRRESDYYFQHQFIPPSLRDREESPQPPLQPQHLPRVEPQPRIESTARTTTTMRNTQQILESLRRRLEEDDRRVLDDEDSTSEPFAHRPFVFGRWYDRPNDRFSPDFLSTQHRDSPAPPRPKTPEPMSKEDLTISNECKVCFSQHCDMLLLPCAHLVLCEVSP